MATARRCCRRCASWTAVVGSGVGVDEVAAGAALEAEHAAWAGRSTGVQGVAPAQAVRGRVEA